MKLKRLPVNLTEKQIDTLITNFNTESDQLTQAEVERYARKLNDKINLPLVSEEKEQKFLEWLIKLVDDQLYKSLPKKYYNLLANSLDGISPDEAELIEKLMAEIITENVNIPYVPAILEGPLVRYALRLLFSVITKGNDRLEPVFASLDYDQPRMAA
jgi:hypothetical protein